MSKKFCATPTLDIEPSESLAASLSLAAIACALGVALVGIVQLGYPLLALTLFPLVLGSLVVLWRERAAGCRIRWENGQWFATPVRGEEVQAVTSHAVLLPYLIHVRYTPIGDARGWTRLIFHDSLEAQELRALRVLLRWSS